MSSVSSLDHGTIYSISGPVIVATNMAGGMMFEVVKIGHCELIGEIIRLSGSTATIQCYETTDGLTVGEPVYKTGQPLSVELGPGIIGSIYDGVQRPLETIAQRSSTPFIPRGIAVPSLSRTRLWDFTPCMQEGELVTHGDVVGTVPESDLLVHKILIPPNVYGRLVFVKGAGKYNVEEVIAKVENQNGKIVELNLFHKWPIRQPRPVNKKLSPSAPLITGQRVLDALFPMTLGSTCCLPGAFGCGKTVISHALAKHSNSDVIVYCGCGERGNEIAEVLMEFPELKTTSKITGQDVSIMERTCLIANTSNMAVSARDASIYTAITIAEYYRDMGYDVCCMADSSSRWAEALREISGRLGEMPADSGYPAYLGGYLARFYERAGRISCLGSPQREGTVSIAAAVSPPGGNFSEPVTVATLAIVSVFWGLDKKFAQRKHFPAVNYLQSFSKYHQTLESFYDSVDPDFVQLKSSCNEILNAEQGLMEIVQLVGHDSLAEEQKITLEVAKMLKEDFLQQNSYSDHDYYCPLTKTVWMLRNIILFHDMAKSLVSSEEKVTLNVIKAHMSETIEKIGRMKYISPSLEEEELRMEFSQLKDEIIHNFGTINL
ncbi:hypothetical protein P9112_000619 [Eukaryota sp. TZLM1-RC]